MNKLENLENKIKAVQDIMIAYATDGRNENQSEEYQNIYIQLDLEIEQAGYTNPNPYKTIESFWKNCGSTWAERRNFVKNIYADLLFDIGRKKLKKKDSRNWKTANQELNDELAPVRQQWLKAKNYIYISPPDYENSMKEAINSYL